METPKEQRPAGSSRRPCRRFDAARIEELLQASNDLSEGAGISYENARDLALYAIDELERVRNVYQSRFMDIANAAITAMRYPSDNASADARRDGSPHPHTCSGS